MVLEAVDRAIDQNVKRWKYISGILSNWQKSNVKTMADVMQLDETYKIKKVVENMQHVGDAMAEIIKRAEAMREEVASREQKHAKLHQTRISAQHARIRKSCFTRK